MGDDLKGPMIAGKPRTSNANGTDANNMVDVTPLITHEMALSEFSLAWKMFTERDGNPIRIMMRP